MDLQRIKAAVARVTTPNSPTQGTAFLVGERLLLTCAHCIATDAAGPDLVPRLDFTEWPEEAKRVFVPGELTLLKVDRGRDLALLELSRPVPPDIQPLKLASDAMLGDAWHSFAYPEPVGDDGLPLDGTIEDTRGRSHGKLRLTLRCTQAADWVRGASGGPVVSGVYVVGMLSKQLGTRDAAGALQTAYQTVYGTCCSEIRASFPQLPIVDTGPFSELDGGVAATQVDYLRQFLGLYLGTEALPVGFGGRGDYLQELERWLADAAHPFGLLVSPAGRGKSALLVRWSEALRSARRTRVAFVPISLRFETARLSDTVTVLLTRLRSLLGVAGPPPADAAAGREEVARLCRDAGGETPLVVVLDGLDEALDWRYDYSRLGLPTALPLGLKVLGSCRTDPNATPSEIAGRLGWYQGVVTLFEELPPLSAVGVGEALASITPSAFALPAELTPKLLHRLSRGDPLLLGLYLEEVADRIAKGALEGLASDLQGREPGWRAYLAKWWEAQCRLWGGELEDRRAATLLCLLAAARGPLGREELVALSKPMEEKERVDSFAFRRVLETVGRLVAPVRRAMPNAEERVALTLSHPQLARFLRELFVERYGLDFARFDAQLVEWCRAVGSKLLRGQTAPQDVPDYVLRHLPEHLLAANGAGELADLLGESWRAARRRVDGSDDAFREDVAKVWAAVEGSWPQQEGDAQHVSDSALRLARCALLTASGLAVEEWPADLVVKMAPSGRWSEGAMLAALQRLRWEPYRVVRAFNDVRKDLSRGALAGLADDPDAEALLRLAAAAELARRDGVTALDAIVARAGGISTETAEAQALVASWLGPSELAKTVDDLRGVLPDRGHVAKKLHAALRVAEALDGEARRQQLDAIRDVITAAAGLGIGQILDAAIGRGDFEPGASAATDGQRLAWVIGRWGLVPMMSASLGFRLEWDPQAQGEMYVADLDAIDMPDLREKRTAQFADTLAGALGPEAALSRVRAIGRPFLRAKGLARIARVRRDPDLLDEAVEAASDHHDALACVAAATELARLSGDEAAREVAGSQGGLIRAALEDPGSHEAWAWAALGKVMTQADCGALCDAMLRELQRGKAGLGVASEILAGILPSAAPAILEATLAVASALPWAMHPPIAQAVGAGLNAARLEELWLSHSDLANAHIRQSIAVPLACRGSAALAGSAVDWCAHRALQDELANIVRDAPEPVARRAWEALLDRREEGPWLIAALKSGVRFSEERAALAAEVVGAAERSASIDGDAYLTYRVLVEGVLHAVPRGEEIGLRAARLAGTLIVVGPQADAAIRRADSDLGWRAQLAVRLPAGAEREALFAETLGIIEQPEPSAGVWATAKRAYRERDSERQVKRDDFNRLLLQLVLETTPEPQELASVLDSFADWSLLLPIQDNRSGKPVDLSLASLCAVPPPTLRPIWARSLRVFATSGRAGLARELAFYAPLLQHTGGTDTARRVAQELLALPRWWP